ncbi:serine/threonine-protein kinase [Acrocarpospora sp. B8E8]|uniref:serine/threonine protein kinase n=1 Tax=Acrocarpospora sp. B8E8 TaxID=3153572 RepID=UPI00325DF10D
MVAPLTPEDPRALGEFTLSGRLGEGGQGVVYLGESPGGGPVAIKVLKSGFDPSVRQRLARELDALRGVASFCTARVITAEVDGREPYVVSEFIDGPSLHDRVSADGPLRGGELERLAVGTATALTAIHGAGIVHRDFKPGNVLLGPDGPRVVDFGIARQSESATMTAGPIGTPAYLSPEQIAGHPASPASDVFAWGATMVYAATGRPAFGADSVASVLHRIMTITPDTSGVPEPLRSTVQRCIDKDPTRRPTSRDLLLTLVGSTPDPLSSGAAAAHPQSPPPGYPPAAAHPTPPQPGYPPAAGHSSWPGQAPQSWPGQSPAPQSWPGQPLGTGPGQNWEQHATAPTRTGGNRGLMIALLVALVAVIGTTAIVVPRIVSGPGDNNTSSSSTTSEEAVDPSETPTDETETAETPTEEPTPSEDTTEDTTEGATVIPDAYAGIWAGRIVPEPQGIMSEHDIRIELPAGESTGKWYEDGCDTGTLTVDKIESDSMVLRLDNNAGCIPGTVILTPKNDKLGYQWDDDAGLVTYKGDLTKEG